MLIARWTMIVIGAAMALVFALGVPLIFSALGAWMAPGRGRRRDTGIAFGTWLGPIYPAYLLLQPKVRYLETSG